MYPRLEESRFAHLPKREIEVCDVGSCSAEALPQGCQTIGVDHSPLPDLRVLALRLNAESAVKTSPDSLKWPIWEPLCTMSSHLF